MTITNDGATILKQLDVEHPAAKVLVELADLQDQEVNHPCSECLNHFGVIIADNAKTTSFALSLRNHRPLPRHRFQPCKKRTAEPLSFKFLFIYGTKRVCTLL